MSSQSSQLPIFWACPELACGAGRGLASEACFLWVHYPPARCPTASDPGRSLLPLFPSLLLAGKASASGNPVVPGKHVLAGEAISEKV